MFIEEHKFQIKDDDLFPEYLHNIKNLSKDNSKKDIIYDKLFYLGINTFYDEFIKCVLTFNENNVLTWRWSTQCCETNFYNIKKKKNISIYKSIYDIIDDYEKSFLKNFSRSKKFKNKYSLLTDQQKQSIYVYSKSMYGLPMRDTTNVLRLDIDNHSDKLINLETQKALKTLFKVLKYPEAFIEQSLNNGYHVYIPFDKQINSEHVKKLLNTLKEKYNITCIDFPKQMRIPNSLNYSVCNIKNKTDFLKLVNTAQCDYLIEEEEQLNFVKNLKNNSYENITNFLKINNKQTEINYKTLPVSRYSKNTDNLLEKYNKVEIGYGNRYFNTLKICSYGLHLGYNPDKIVNDIYTRDTGSKDLKNLPYEKIYKEVENILNVFKKTYKPLHNFQTSKNSSKNFISNIDLVPDKIKNCLNETVKLILSDMNIIRKNKKEILFNPIKNLLLEMSGQFIYDSLHEKQLHEKTAFTKDIIYTQFSQKWLNLFKEHYNISNIDINRIFKTIIKLKIFNQKFYEYLNNRNEVKQLSWLYINYRSCKQYFIDIDNNTNTIINTLYTFLLSIKNKYKYLLNKLDSKVFLYNKINNISKVYDNFIYQDLNFEIDTG